jgi:hypothetical protein
MPCTTFPSRIPTPIARADPFHAKISYTYIARIKNTLSQNRKPTAQAHCIRSAKELLCELTEKRVLAEES